MRLIEELRRRENELENQNAVLNSELDKSRVFISAIDQSSESIFFTDVKGHIIYVNRSFELTSGYSREELIGNTPRLLKSGKHSQEDYQKIWATLLRGETYRGHMINKRKDGSLFHEEANITPVHDENGKIVKFVAVKVNITPWVEGQRILEGINSELSRSNSELEYFASVASHDLQEPLRSVSSCLQLLKKRYENHLDARANELISRAVAGSHRMRALIDDLLALSKVNISAVKLVETDSAAIFEQVCANLAHAIEESGATISQEGLPMVISTPQMLLQLLQNLISNAIKFRAHRPPVIHVRARRDGDKWVFSVADQGIGISPEHYDRIFQFFQRLHTTEAYPGTGLGLAICKKIVDQHGGEIWVESTPGMGATFFFTQPAVPPPA